MIRAYVSGTPRPRPRPRFVGVRVVSTASRHAKLWRNTMLAEFLRAREGAAPIVVPVAVHCIAFMPTPKRDRWGKPHAIRPDKDNLEKCVLDCLVKAGVIKDDGLVADGSFRKQWSERAGMDVQVCLPGELREE